MDLINLLKELKQIEADRAYTSRSRSLIVGTSRPGGVAGVWRTVVHSIQFGSAVALASVLLILIVGGFSAWQAFSPFKLSSLDPASLRAEAQAVDIQIQLTDIAYPEPSLERGSSTAVSTLPSAAAPAPIKLQTPKGAANGPALTTPDGTLAAPPAIGIDEALDRLAE
jgi:hypothetical protein